jgi:hypothetical protein
MSMQIKTTLPQFATRSDCGCMLSLSSRTCNTNVLQHRITHQQSHTPREHGIAIGFLPSILLLPQHVEHLFPVFGCSRGIPAPAHVPVLVLSSLTHDSLQPALAIIVSLWTQSPLHCFRVLLARQPDHRAAAETLCLWLPQPLVMLCDSRASLGYLRRSSSTCARTNVEIEGNTALLPRVIHQVADMHARQESTDQ